MSKNKKVLIGILIAVLIIVIGAVAVYILIEKDVTNRENLDFRTENISSSPVDTKNNDDNEHYFFGKVIESTASYIIVEPNENEEIRKSSDKISIGLGKFNDAIYKVGTNVKVTYDGTVMESYPAQVRAIKIELKSIEKFNLAFYQKTMISPNQKETIISKGEIANIDYNVYAFEGHVAINLNSDSSNLTESSLSLREALLQNKITMEEIIAKANKDFPNATSYDDGGSIEYHYENYTIIKCHTLDGNRDVYIGTKDLKLKDININSNDINNNTENSTFTKTYNVLNVADSNDENYIYLTIRQFQEEEVKTVKVQRSLANGIEITKDYEFTFKYTDKKVEENIESIFTNTKLISIKKTDKQGLEQIQDSIRS